MKIITIIGARPQFIKAGSVSREIRKRADIQEIIVHTGQHYDSNMSDIFFEEMKIPKPDYFLGIGGGSHGAMTGKMIEKIEEVVVAEKPDWMIVYGDTNSTLAGAIVASKLHVKLAHIEAGLRSFNMKMPEEINRILTDRISQVLFCPTDRAVSNLLEEGYDKFKCEILKVGDVMYDGALFYKNFARKINLDLQKEYVLCTVHRAENTNNIERLKSIFEALNEISGLQQIVLPLHPRTKKVIDSERIYISEKVKVINPVGYLEMVWLLENSDLVITDSGGLQKEAFFFKKPCITLRDETEWSELVDNGYNKLTGANKIEIIKAFNDRDKIFLNDFSQNLYGEGDSSKKIIDYLCKNNFIEVSR